MATAPAGPSAAAVGVGAWVYPDTYSIFPGETLRLHVSATQPNVRVRVYKLTDWGGDGVWSGAPILDLGRVAIQPRLFKPNRNLSGGIDLTGTQDWNWPQNVNVPVPATWASGIYIVEVAAFAGNSAQLPGEPNWTMFVVRKRPSADASPILYKFNLNTMQAYNLATHREVPGTGPSGTSVFNNDFYVNPVVTGRPGSTGSYRVTFRRPVWMWVWINKSILYDYPLVKWIEQQGYAADYCTDLDIHADASLEMLSRYPLLLSSGHDEYWSAAMRENLVKYRNRGGNIAFLSGNTCCWRVALADVSGGVPTSMFVDKGAMGCDVAGPDAWWKVDPVHRENGLIGVGTRHCAIRGEGSLPFTLTDPASPGFRIQQADHWIFNGTGLADGDVVGVGNMKKVDNSPITENLVGYEGGGARITLNADGSATPTYDDGTPPNFVILGVGQTMPAVWACNRRNSVWWAFSREGSEGAADGDPYAATMGTYSGYGSVFTASTIHWPFILNSWDAQGGIFRNVPQQWQGGAPANDADGRPILGNQFLHRITRNVFDAFLDRRRNVVAVTDLDRNGVPDLVMQTAATGEPGYWLLDGTTRTGNGSIIYRDASPGSRFRIVGAGNLTAEDSTDLVLQDQADGHLEFWTVAPDGNGGITRTANGRITTETPGNLTFVAVAVLDLNQDGRADILFQNQETGALWCWLLTDLELTESVEFVPDFADLEFRVVAALDLNGDGQQDLLFQNQTDGSLFFWLLEGTTRTEFDVLTAGPMDPLWKVVGAGDLRADGTQLILFQHQTGGAIEFSVISEIAEIERGALDGGRSPWYID